MRGFPGPWYTCIHDCNSSWYYFHFHISLGDNIHDWTDDSQCSPHTIPESLWFARRQTMTMKTFDFVDWLSSNSPSPPQHWRKEALHGAHATELIWSMNGISHTVPFRAIGGRWYLRCCHCQFTITIVYNSYNNIIINWMSPVHSG